MAREQTAGAYTGGMPVIVELGAQAGRRGKGAVGVVNRSMEGGPAAGAAKHRGHASKPRGASEKLPIQDRAAARH